MSRKRSAGKKFKTLASDGLFAAGKGGVKILVRKDEDKANGRYQYVVMRYDPMHDLKPVARVYHCASNAEFAVLDVQRDRRRWQKWDGSEGWWL